MSTFMTRVLSILVLVMGLVSMGYGFWMFDSVGPFTPTALFEIQSLTRKEPLTRKKRKISNHLCVAGNQRFLRVCGCLWGLHDIDGFGWYHNIMHGDRRAVHLRGEN